MVSNITECECVQPSPLYVSIDVAQQNGTQRNHAEYRQPHKRMPLVVENIGEIETKNELCSQVSEIQQRPRAHRTTPSRPGPAEDATVPRVGIDSDWKGRFDLEGK